MNRRSFLWGIPAAAVAAPVAAIAVTGAASAKAAKVAALQAEINAHRSAMVRLTSRTGTLIAPGHSHTLTTEEIPSHSHGIEHDAR